MPSVDGYVNSLGQSIASRTSRADLQWQFAVVNTDVINAFALPGGFVYVNRGVLARASNESELAGVLAHEIEHVVRRHSVKQMEQAQQANVGVGLVCVAHARVREPGGAGGDSGRRRGGVRAVQPRRTRCRPTRAASRT